MKRKGLVSGPKEVAPPCRPRLVAVGVEAQVEPGAGADLEDAQPGDPGVGCRVEDPTEQADRPSRLVGLHPERHGGRQLDGMVLDDVQEPDAEVRGRGAADRRVVGGEVGRASVEHEPVHGGKEPQHDGIGERAVGPWVEDAGAGTAALHVLGHGGEQLGVERGPVVEAAGALDLDEVVEPSATLRCAVIGSIAPDTPISDRRPSVGGAGRGRRRRPAARRSRPARRPRPAPPRPRPAR